MTYHKDVYKIIQTCKKLYLNDEDWHYLLRDVDLSHLDAALRWLNERDRYPRASGRLDAIIRVRARENFLVSAELAQDALAAIIEDSH